MQKVTRHLRTDRTSPRLWFERLIIFREPDPAHYIRTVTFRRGLNLIWAKEPASGDATGIHAAGHGVGKTSLCLLLRFCLGDTAKTITELLEELYGEFPKGGVAAVLHVDDKPFTLCRYFGSHKEGGALAGADTEELLQGGHDQSDRQFEQLLAETMMSKLYPRAIPETGQAIEWRHLLAWMTRDQGSRFKSFFAWREGEGAGLQRPRQDPPIVMRAVLGLLDQTESELMTQATALERDLEKAKQETARHHQEPILIRRRIESELRAWQGISDDLPLRSDDLFKSSVERVIETADSKASANFVGIDAQYDASNQVLYELKAELNVLEKQCEKAEMEYGLAEAARRNDVQAYQAIAERLSKLKELTGWCEYGNSYFQECQHIRHELARLQATDMKDGRDKSALTLAIAESATQMNAALHRKIQLDAQLEEMRGQVSKKIHDVGKIRIARDSAALEVNRGKRVLEELDRWERAAGSPEAQTAIDNLASKTQQIASDIVRTNTKLMVLRQERSSREKCLSEIIDALAGELLSDEAFGRFKPRDEARPFQLSMRGGEAYRVLEVLLGDLTCLLDGANEKSLFPSLIIHDCPREADMSSGLYENFLLLVERIQRECFGAQVPFQYIVTTTTPPPSAVLKGDYLRSELDPSKDEELLFRQRFSNELFPML